MEKKALSGLILTLLWLAIITSAFNIKQVKAEPTIWYVDDDGPADFSSIQEAIDNPQVMDGDTIYVYDGIYYENVVVSKELSLVGQDSTTTIIDGMETGTVVAIAADNVMIGEFTIRGSRKPSVEYTPSTDTGVLVFAGYSQTVENATIFNNDIRNNYMGIFILYSLNDTVVDSKIENNFIGIGIDEAIHNSILRNTLSSNVGGIWLGSGGNSISGNNISSNSEYGVQLDGSLQNTVDRNVIENNGYGIDVSSSSNNIISGNNITANNGHSIYISSSSNNNITENIITNNTWGVGVANATFNTIYDNYIANAMNSGVFLIGSYNNTLFGNKITNSLRGVQLQWSFNNTIQRNKIRDNTQHGVIIQWNSHNNSLFENNIENHEYGIWFSESSNNKIYHNNLINNDLQVDGYASANVWDDGYPSGGNYWSDYGGVDDNRDGIGDTPYVIDENNQDRYPLMSLWIERTVGVKVGDWAKYSVDSSWTGVIDPRWELLSQTEWGSVEVTDVSGTVVTFTGTSHFKNGSELTVHGVKWDIAPTGSFGIVLYFIGSDLQAGDRLFPSGTLRINETVTRTYIGVPRENNHHNSSGSGLAPGYDLYKLDCYWDQSTGILTEESLEMSMTDLSRSLSFRFKMVNTNLWEAPNPVEETQELIETIETWSLRKGTENSLTGKLKGAIHLLDIGNENGAIHKLMDFINQVEALRGKKLDEEQADYLISEAQRIIDLIEG